MEDKQPHSGDTGAEVKEPTQEPWTRVQSCDINAEVARGGAAADMRDGTFQSTQMGRSLAGGVTGAAFSRVSV